jgi:hypothetical protein
MLALLLLVSLAGGVLLVVAGGVLAAVYFLNARGRHER